MAAPFLLIDGYNLMHAAGLFRRKFRNNEFAQARHQFLQYLANHLEHDERQRTTIVFDAQNPPSFLSAPHYFFDEMTVIFSTGQDADTLIEEMLRQHSAPRQILLISSDHRLQKAARRRRAKSADSDEFIAELNQHGPINDAPIDSTVKPPSSASRSQKQKAKPESQTAEPQKESASQHPKFTGETSAAETAMWLELFDQFPPPEELTLRNDTPAAEELDGNINDASFWKIDVNAIQDES